jgi:CheY-like chemotaxis protein
MRGTPSAWHPDDDTMALRVLIVDDNAHFLEAARHLLEQEGMVVVGVASTGAEAQARCAELRPDAALVDVDLGGESGFDVARSLLQAPSGQAPSVVLISTYAEQDLRELIATSPAVGFLSKSDLSGLAIRELLAAVDPP